jgi:hypothetical protein
MQAAIMSLLGCQDGANMSQYGSTGVPAFLPDGPTYYTSMTYVVWHAGCLV